MNKKRKISWRKILQAFVTLVVTSGCIAAILSASYKQDTKNLNNISLYVKNESKYQLLDKDALWNDVVEKKGIKEHRSKIARIDIHSMETAALKNPWVSDAQVYVDNNRDLHINVTQRIPVARVFFENGESSYLDASLNLLPLSEQFTYYTTIVMNVPSGNDSIDRKLYAQIVKLVRFIERDSFYSAQIAQVIVTDDKKFELVPVLGTQRIFFGDTTLMKEKFRNLFAFYKNVLNRIGWDKYEVLDLSFNGQIVASPALPWKPPSKNAISNMDWLKSIMDETPKVSNAMTSVKPTKQEPVKAQDSKPRKATTAQKVETKKAQTGKYIYQGNIGQ